MAGALGLACLYRGMAIGAIGVVAPISASAAVIPVTVGLARGERPERDSSSSASRSRSSASCSSRASRAASGRLSAGVPLALVAALGFGGYFVFIDRASADDAYWAVVVARAFSATLALAVARVTKRAAAPGPSNLPVLVAIGLFDVGANLALALALNEGYVSLVSVVASLYPVVTVLLAVARAARAARRARRRSAALIALTGVGLISAAA